MNVLIIEKDIKYCNKLIKILKRSLDLKLCIVSSYYDEINNFISGFNFSIILIDSKLKKDFNNILKKHSDSIIIINSKETKKDNEFISINKTDSFDEINSKINKILSSSNSELNKKIKDELKYLGYNPKYYGTKYLQETIYYLLTHEDIYSYESNLEKDIYPLIAKKYNKSVNTVKCNIINATDIMVCECEESKLLNYLGYYDYSKPGPKKIIEGILAKLLN